MWQIIDAYIGLLIMLTGTFTFGKIVLNEKIKIKKTKFFLLTLLIAIIQTIVGLNLSGTIKTIIMVISNVCFYKLTFKISYKKSMLLALLQMFILIIPDLLELFFLTKVLGFSKEQCYNFYARSINSNIIIILLLIIITYILRKILRRLINEKLEDNKKIICQLILTFICVIMFFYIIIQEFRFQDNVMVYIISILVGVF